MTRASRRVRAPRLLVSAFASCALFAFASLNIVADARAQTRAASRAASGRPRLRVSRDGRNVVFVERGRAHTLALDESVGAARIEVAKLLFLTRREEFVYLLIDVCGTSKRRPDDRQCGAGRECNIIWVKLDRGRKVADARSELYESCWLPVTSERGPRIDGRRMSLELENLREWVIKEVGYDADRPEEMLTFKFFAIPRRRD